MKNFFCFIGIVCIHFLIMTPLNAAPPATMTYQGKLKTAQGVRVNSPTTLTFRIYDAATGGTKLWEETLSNVTVVDGSFKVILGKTTSLTTLPFDKAYYLSMQVNTDVEMSPRMEMTSAPYAMNTVKQSSAGAAETLLKTLTTPKNVTISPSGSGQASVTWNPVDGATSYNLYLATESGVNASNYASKANGKAITGVTSPYTVTGLTNGTQYFFSMASVTPVGESVASVEGKVTVTAIPVEGLVGYWPFNGNANDESGNGNHGTVYRATLAPDRFGQANKAYQFNGVDNYINITSNKSLNPTNQLTISFWIKINNFTKTPSYIFYKAGQTIDEFKNREYTVFLNPTGFHIATAGDNKGQHYYDTNPVTKGEWIHCAIIIDRIHHLVQFFINGAMINEYTDSYSSFNNNNYDLRLGLGDDRVFADLSPFSGFLDNIRMYNRALSKADIQILYSEIN
ncbi:MAG: fibronectin type III domain-containing protein [Magnetococcus sp. YQC-5]